MATSVTLRHYGKVVNGVRIYYNKPLHQENINELEDQEFEEVIKLKHKKVSTDAHGYYRGGILGTCMDYEMFGGWTKDEIHEHFSDLFLSYWKAEKTMDKEGFTVFKDVKKVTSTGSLNSKEMFEYCEKCIQWLADKGIVIHPPEHYLLGKYKTT